jgi:ABC-type multidrug transport system fused ATPase/permease subunit
MDTNSISNYQKLQFAFEARNFELKLFWKRSAYFSALIGVTGYLYANSINKQDPYALILVSAIGIILNFAWVLANKGSKYWYESWEMKMEMFDFNINANKIPNDVASATDYEEKKAQKTPEERQNNRDTLFIQSNIAPKTEKIFNGNTYSVSRIAIFISEFFLFSWLVLFLFSIILLLSGTTLLEIYKNKLHETHYKLIISILITIVLIITTIFLAINSKNEIIIKKTEKKKNTKDS